MAVVARSAVADPRIAHDLHGPRGARGRIVRPEAQKLQGAPGAFRRARWLATLQPRRQRNFESSRFDGQRRRNIERPKLVRRIDVTFIIWYWQAALDLTRRVEEAKTDHRQVRERREYTRVTWRQFDVLASRERPVSGHGQVSGSVENGGGRPARYALARRRVVIFFGRVLHKSIIRGCGGSSRK